MLDRVSFTGVRLENPRLHELIVRGSTLTGCTFAGRLADSGDLGSLPDPLAAPEHRFGASVYRDCRFQGCDLAPLEPGWTRFEGCVFADCRIEEWFAFDASFVDCAFPGTSLRSTTFAARSYRVDSNRRPYRNDVRGNDFSGAADLLWTSFLGGVDLAAQTWPEDDEITILTDIGERIAWAKEQVERGSDPERRGIGLFLLGSLTTREGPEQRDLFHHRGTIGQPEMHELAKDLYALLEQAPA